MQEMKQKEGRRVFFPSVLGYGHITNNMKQAEQFLYF